MERSADWMYEAERDLEHARHDAAAEFHNWACFSAQQGAEKAVNAVFQKMGSEAWGHSVAGLLRELSTRKPIPQGLMEMAQERIRPTSLPATPMPSLPVPPANSITERRRID